MESKEPYAAEAEKPDSFWNRVYAAVVVVTVVVVTALWSFSRYFSS